jgi:N-acetylglucosamine-6-sulfatase
MLAAIDESTGAIVEALKDAGELADTLIVFTSDHGYFYGEHGLSTERRLAFEESIRIPLVMWHAKLKDVPRKVAHTVLSVDVAPTLLELGRAEKPRKMHGRSLVPLLDGVGTFPSSRDVLIQYYSDTVFPRVRKMGYTAIRTERWKYIQYKELTGADELYDLSADPYEMKNLISDPSVAGTVREMKAKLAAEMEAAR